MFIKHAENFVSALKIKIRSKSFSVNLSVLKIEIWLMKNYEIKPNSAVDFFISVAKTSGYKAIVKNQKYLIEKEKNPCQWCVIYVIQSGTSFKLGFSKESRIKERLGQLQIGNPSTLKLILSIRVYDPVQIERILLEKYRKKRIRGEWFELTKRDIENIEKFLYAQ